MFNPFLHRHAPLISIDDPKFLKIGCLRLGPFLSMKVLYYEESNTIPLFQRLESYLSME